MHLIFVSSSSPSNTQQEEIFAQFKIKNICVAYTTILCLAYFLQITLMTTATNCCEWIAEQHKNSNSLQTTFLLLYEYKLGLVNSVYPDCMHTYLVPYTLKNLRIEQVQFILVLLPIKNHRRITTSWERKWATATAIHLAKGYTCQISLPVYEFFKLSY